VCRTTWPSRSSAASTATRPTTAPSANRSASLKRDRCPGASCARRGSTTFRRRASRLARATAPFPAPRGVLEPVDVDVVARFVAEVALGPPPPRPPQDHRPARGVDPSPCAGLARVAVARRRACSRRRRPLAPGERAGNQDHRRRAHGIGTRGAVVVPIAQRAGAARRPAPAASFASTGQGDPSSAESRRPVRRFAARAR
jgi:hypothetical protein